MLSVPSFITLSPIGGINSASTLRRICAKLFDRVQKQSFRFDNNKTGHLVSRMTNDLMDIGEIAHHGPEDLFIAVMTLAGALGIMLGLNWELAVMTFVIVPLMVYLSLYFSGKMSALSSACSPILPITTHGWRTTSAVSEWYKPSRMRSMKWLVSRRTTTASA